MNRFLLPPAVAALMAGCSMPTGLGQQSNQPAVADPPQTVIVREVRYTDPVVYTDTVYVPEQTQYQQPVYAGDEYNTYNEYNEYNQYNENYVYVHKEVVIPPRSQPRWSRPDRNPQRRDRPDGSQNNWDQPRKPEQPKVLPQHPAKKTYAPVMNVRHDPVDPPTPSVQPVQLKRQAPVPGGSAPATLVRKVVPKQAPTPPDNRPVASGSVAASQQPGDSPSRVPSTGQPAETSPVQLAANGQ